MLNLAHRHSQHPVYLGLKVEGEQPCGDGGHVGVGGGALARAHCVDLPGVLQKVVEVSSNLCSFSLNSPTFLRASASHTLSLLMGTLSRWMRAILRAITALSAGSRTSSSVSDLDD